MRSNGQAFHPIHLFVNCLRLRRREDFLKARIISQRIPFPALSQI